MKIVEVDVRLVSIALKEPSELAASRHDRIVSSVVTVTLADGTVGYGEARMPGPGLSPDTAETVDIMVRRYYGPALVGQDVEEIQQLMRRLENVRTGHIFAKAALDIALHDALSRRLGVPVTTLLGGRVRSSFPLVGWIGLLPPTSAAEKAKAFVGSGFRQIKLKLGTTHSEDVERVRAVRDAIGSDTKLRVDTNGHYGAADSVELARRIAPYEIELLEDPVPESNRRLLREVRQRSPIPICADSVVRTAADAVDVLAEDAADYLKVKVIRVGGILEARRILTVANAFGKSVVLGRGTCGDLEAAAELQLALSAENVVAGGEMVGPSKLVANIVAQPIDMQHGEAPGPEGPGLGVTVDAEALARYTVLEVASNVGYKG